MAFCINCGQEIKKGAKFCHNCGTAVYTPSVEENDRRERKIVYDGEIHKCPNCGEIINSFEARCSSCGWEIRSTRSSDAVKKLADKLEQIDARQMPPIEEKESVMEIVFGRDFKGKNKLEKAEWIFEDKKEDEKSNLISNFIVPNTREDILEFMLLASSNINIKNGIYDSVTEAWIAKLDQVYKRAEITLKNTSSFAQIKEIYDTKKNEIKLSQRKEKFSVIGLSIGCYFILGLLWNPIVTISIAIVIMIPSIIAFKIFKK